MLPLRRSNVFISRKQNSYAMLNITTFWIFAKSVIPADLLWRYKKKKLKTKNEGINL